jgi:hypothetical protein
MLARRSPQTSARFASETRAAANRIKDRSESRRQPRRNIAAASLPAFGHML